MNRFAPLAAATLVLCSPVLLAGCGNSAIGGLTTGSNLTAGSAPAGMSNTDPNARPAHVAWIAARGQRCGFYFDPAKLRAAYIAYESKQGTSGPELGKIEATYDTTFKATLTSTWADPNYCTDRKAADIKAQLARHLAGDYTPDFPKPKQITQCGGIFDPCDSGRSDEPFDSKKFWQKQDTDKNKR